MRLVGRARDIVTPRSGGSPIPCAEDGFEASLDSNRTILEIVADPSRAALAHLAGARGGGHLRRVLEEVAPEERRNATPLYLILDDISGASLIAPWAWSQWDPNWLAQARAGRGMTENQWGEIRKKMEGICTGFAPGSSALDPNRMMANHTNAALTQDLRHPDDPDGWHAFTVQDTVGMRRARRIDVSVDKVIVIDAAFQDSATKVDGGRAVLHEYRITATADPVSSQLLSIEAEPRVLPYSECPGAAKNISRLIGAELQQLRETVLDKLPGTLGCTHLNDALRALAEVPALVSYLRSSQI
jgi:hypothetical protein